jgi:hypothetical protein
VTAGRVVERAREDVELGRLWKARDRLTGAVGHRPHDAEVLDLLGEVYYRMDDLPAAGRAWLLAGRTGPEVDRALAAFVERAPRAIDRLTQLGARAPLDGYPHLARERISSLREDAGHDGHEWSPRPAVGDRRTGDEGDDSEGRRWYGGLVAGVVLVLTVGVWLLGMAAAVWLVVAAVS